MAKDLDALFTRLRAVMAPHTAGMDVVRDLPGDYYVNTRHVRSDGYVFMFGAVQTRARYVSYHLMPLYGSTALNDGLTESLRRRKHGKACLNFTTLDDDLLADLAELTASAAVIAASPTFVTGEPG